MEPVEEAARTAQDVIRRYDLRPHPEGGYFREVYRSTRSLGTPPGYAGERTAMTAIYFLLERGDFSAFHRVRSDEVWVHLAGAPLELVLLNEEPGSHRLSAAGSGGVPLVAVPAETHQAARTLGDWTLAACFVAPGFDFADFELPGRESLLRAYPARAELILRFSRT